MVLVVLSFKSKWAKRMTKADFARRPSRSLNRSVSILQRALRLRVLQSATPIMAAMTCLSVSLMVLDQHGVDGCAAIQNA